MKKLYFIAPFLLQTLSWIPARILLKFFCHFEVHGLENIKGLKQAIFAPNHISELDPILVPAALPMFSSFLPMFYTAAEDKNFKNSARFGWRSRLYGGLFFKAWGAYPINSGKKNYSVALEKHLEILENRGSLCIFPEGTISSDGKVQAAHGGVVFLAEKSKSPIVPISISGFSNISLSRLLFRKIRIRIDFGKPQIITQEQILGPQSYGALAQGIMNFARELSYQR